MRIILVENVLPGTGVVIIPAEGLKDITLPPGTFMAQAAPADCPSDVLTVDNGHRGYPSAQHALAAMMELLFPNIQRDYTGGIHWHVIAGWWLTTGTVLPTGIPYEHGIKLTD